jgi:hypothetical protein
LLFLDTQTRRSFIQPQSIKSFRSNSSLSRSLSSKAHVTKLYNTTPNLQPITMNSMDSFPIPTGNRPEEKTRDKFKGVLDKFVG